ncbi:SGNH/GDSL hydrolase family protein [Streptomyces sp. L2]|uniref:SGNH/GDSL hydrolase family protein n=1 Tax=Streptomyces sp. L2 TaxID=2162665 RepID=UPI001F51040E|nr:SGNH/GDSL hydrolase family protein [Streptomyces sp. L2]
MGSTAVALLGAAGTSTGAPPAGADPARIRPSTLHMVSLGDSYAAGYTRLAGGPVEPDEPGKSGCEQTLESYPYVLRKTSAGLLGQTRDVTCGGATTGNVLDTPQQPVGHASLDRFGIPQADPLAPFPKRPPQIEAVRADTDIVTLGIGGNDYFSPLASECLRADASSDAPAHCRDNLESGAYAGLGLPADDPDLDGPRRALADRYRTLLDAVHARAPHARIYVIGYPSVIPADPRTCARNSQELFTLGRGDIGWLGRLLDGVNEAVASATADAHRHGVPAEFVDTRRATLGKDACAPRAVKWVEGYTEKIGTIGVGGWGDPALIHPNRRYHQYVAGQLAHRIRDDFAARLPATGPAPGGPTSPAPGGPDV